MNEIIKVSPELETGIQRLLSWSQTVCVKNNDERLNAIETTIRVKKYRTAIIDFFKDSKAKAHSTWKAIVANEKHFTDKLDHIETKVKSAILIYDRKQEEIRRIEQAKLQAEADARARRERERLEKEAEKLKTPEKKQERLDEAASVVAPVVQVESNVEKINGINTRKTWKARVIDISLVPREYLIVNQKALDAFARATKGNVKLPGVEFYEESALSVRI